VEGRTKVKLGVGLVIVVLLVIFIVQNRQPVDVILIWGKVAVPLALVIFLMLAVGFVAGYLVAWATRRPHARRLPPKTDSAATKDS
jgi:uncharacterized integral membrane protein